MAKRKGNFSERVVRLLRDRAGNVCSNPQHQVSTAGPTADSGALISGDAAHIRSASPGGARYDKTMTDAQRSSIENGIWLCKDCAWKVDHDEISYPITLLNAWKQAAESAARARQNGRVFSASEVVAEVQAGISGFARAPLVEGIHRMHLANKQALEDADPRFVVNTGYQNGTTTIELKARNQPVQLGIFIPSELLGVFQEKLEMLEAWGKPLEISGPSIRMTGSPIFDLPSEGPNRLVVGRHGVATSIKVFLEKDGLSEFFETFVGEARGGTKGATIFTVACDSIISLELDVGLGAAEAEHSNFSLRIDATRWEGADVRSLSYLDATQHFVTRLLDGWAFKCHVESKGIPVLTISPIQLNDTEFLESYFCFLEYTKRASQIATFVGEKIAFTYPKVGIPRADALAVLQAARMIEGTCSFKPAESQSFCSFRLKPTTSLLNDSSGLSGYGINGRWRVVEHEGHPIEIFGQTITLPPRTITFEGARFELSKPLCELQPDDLVDVTVIAGPDGLLTASYCGTLD